MNVKSSRYFFQLETWVKFGSLGLAIILPPAIMVEGWEEAEWPRHVATGALLLAWIQMMFLLSRFPNWGYYVLMFGKVASNVVKVRKNMFKTSNFENYSLHHDSMNYVKYRLRRNGRDIVVTIKKVTDTQGTQTLHLSVNFSLSFPYDISYYISTFDHEII